jgi:ribosomal protein S18 acetylase RimI-like enzyme
MSTFTIRDAAKADIPDLIRLETVSFDSDTISKRSFARLVGSPTAVCRLAFQGEAPSAYCVLLFRQGSGIARLYSIAVDPARRGGGLAKALLADAERLAERRGRSALRLEVRDTNPAAIRLYERSGYRPIGRRQGYYADGTDAHVYEKRLGSGGDEDRSPRDSPARSAYIERVQGTRPGTSPATPPGAASTIPSYAERILPLPR